MFEGKNGLVLSGGGIRSFAHLGMIAALEESKITFNYVSGSSAGAVLGAFYCKGYAPQEILEIMSSINFFKLFKPALNRQGIFKLEKSSQIFNKYFPENSFSSLKNELTVAATNLDKGEIEYFESGELIRPLLASCSIPMIFSPVIIKEESYIDGGVLDNLPITPLIKKCDFMFGMHCNPIGRSKRVKSWRQLLERSMLMAISSRDYLKKGKFDIFWEPDELINYSVFDFKKIREIYKIGYNYGKLQLNTITSELAFTIK